MHKNVCRKTAVAAEIIWRANVWDTTTTTLKRCIALYKWYVIVCSPHRFWHTGKKCCQCHVNSVVLLYGATSYIPFLRMFRIETKRRKTRRQQLQLNRAISRNGNESGDHGSWPTICKSIYLFLSALDSTHNENRLHAINKSNKI